jgi:hypothetical protein
VRDLLAVEWTNDYNIQTQQGWLYSVIPNQHASDSAKAVVIYRQPQPRAGDRDKLKLTVIPLRNITVKGEEIPLFDDGATA